MRNEDEFNAKKKHFETRVFCVFYEMILMTKATIMIRWQCMCNGSNFHSFKCKQCMKLRIARFGRFDEINIIQYYYAIGNLYKN